MLVGRRSAHYDGAMREPETSEPRPATIVPVYNDWSSLQQLARAIAGLSDPRPWLIVVDDGSGEPGPDLEALAGMGLDGEILRLRRNFGHQQAIAAGVCHGVARNSEGPIVIMDGLTKNWRYPGWRVTWTVGPKRVIEAITSAGSFLDGGGSKGLQEQVILAGTYFLNPKFASVLPWLRF